MAEVINQISELDALKEKYLTFYMDSQRYGLEIQYVLEIIGVQSVTKVPKVPSFIVGVTNLRGKVIPIIDLRIRFGKMEKPYDSDTCVIVVEIDEVVMGLIVDGVDEVVEIPESALSEPPRVEWDYSSNFLKGISRMNGQFSLILDCHKILVD